MIQSRCICIIFSLPVFSCNTWCILYIYRSVVIIILYGFVTQSQWQSVPSSILSVDSGVIFQLFSWEVSRAIALRWPDKTSQGQTGYDLNVKGQVHYMVHIYNILDRVLAVSVVEENWAEFSLEFCWVLSGICGLSERQLRGRQRFRVWVSNL